MLIRAVVVVACVTVTLTLVAPGADGYITYPPMTLEKMCKMSNTIRVLKVTKHSKEAGVIRFEVVETIKKPDESVDPAKHVAPKTANKVGPVLDWMKDGKQAVMFSIDGGPKGAPPTGVGYVFIDNYCYFVDFNASEKYWLVVRGDPGMSACYHGPAEKLPALVKDVLAGKKVQVPTKEPEVKEDVFKRNAEIKEIILKNRKK